MKSIIKIKKQAKNLSKERKLKIKDALDIISKEKGFSSWKELRNSLDTFWYEKSSPFLTEWFTTHAEANSYLSKKQGYLLTYKGQYFVVDADYIEFIGIDPSADIWKSIGHDVSSSNSFDKLYDYLRKNNSKLVE